MPFLLTLVVVLWAVWVGLIVWVNRAYNWRRVVLLVMYACIIGPIWLQCLRPLIGEWAIIVIIGLLVAGFTLARYIINQLLIADIERRKRASAPDIERLP